LNTSTISAQTRGRRAQSEPEKSSKPVDRSRRAPATEREKSDAGRQATGGPLVRKTALTYTKPTGNTTAGRPVLVNDITVASSITKDAPVILSSARRDASSNIPSIWPVAGLLRSGFGVRSNPFGGSSREFHKGQDIVAPMGAPVIATADGTVTIAGWLRGYGRVVYIDHGNGITTRYGHLSRIDVEVGQTVRRGEQLGLVGSTGRSTGPHLHYEVLIDGRATNPIPYLPVTVPGRS
jgi:murein DD-endopeptidase MepM/ murein hydrolase activator NlpD